MNTINTYRNWSRFTVHPARAAERQAFSLLAAAGWIEAILERRRSRLALAEMTDEQLKDIGISRYDAHQEARRPFWS